MLLRGCDRVADLSTTARLASLTRLALPACVDDAELARICAGARDLAALEIVGAQGVSDLAPLRRLSSLKSLALVRCASIRYLEALAELQGLERIDLLDCPSIRDVSQLRVCRTLRTLVIIGCARVSEADVATLAAALPQCTVYASDAEAPVEPEQLEFF